MAGRWRETYQVSRSIGAAVRIVVMAMLIVPLATALIVGGRLDDDIRPHAIRTAAARVIVAVGAGDVVPAAAVWQVPTRARVGDLLPLLLADPTYQPAVRASSYLIWVPAAATGAVVAILILILLGGRGRRDDDADGARLRGSQIATASDLRRRMR
jgi:hypothetical protein